MPFSPDLPIPPVPADCDLRGLPYYPLNLQRLVRSTFHNQASPAEWKAGLLLWMKSWDQTPSGSLPNNDRELASLAEVRDVRAWLKLKEVSLHGWDLHSDGRYYHPVVTEVTLHAWKLRKVNRRRGTAGAEARWTPMRQACPKDAPSMRDGCVADGKLEVEVEDLSDRKEAFASSLSDRSSCPNGHSPRARGELQVNPRVKGTNPRQIGADFLAFWAAYPRKVGKQEAIRKYEIARRAASADEILHGAQRYAAAMAGVEKRYVAYPEKWLHHGRWQDEDVEVQQRRKTPLEKLYEGAMRAADAYDARQEQPGSGGADSSSSHPLLDRR